VGWFDNPLGVLKHQEMLFCAAGHVKACDEFSHSWSYSMDISCAHQQPVD
jgi:hypothetical protein